MYHNFESVKEAFNYFHVRFAPNLLQRLQNPTPPSGNELISCSIPDIDLTNDMAVYLHFIRCRTKIQVFGYCGSGVSILGRRPAFTPTTRTFLLDSMKLQCLQESWHWGMKWNA